MKTRTEIVEVLNALHDDIRALEDFGPTDVSAAIGTKQAALDLEKSNRLKSEAVAQPDV